MAMTTMGSYYADEGPEIPSAGGDYGAPTPHAAKVGQHPFEAPSGNAAVSEGFAATDDVKVTSLGQMSSPAPGRAQAAFDAAGEQDSGQDF